MKDNNIMISENAVMAKDWILNSGIQNLPGPDAGGFNAWYDLEKGEHSYVYSEITGYGITTLLFLSKYFVGDFISRARLAADWITKKAMHECGGVKTRNYLLKMREAEHYSFESGNIYAFDNGMVLYGLVNLYKFSKDASYLKVASGIADFLIAKMLRSDGFFYAVYNPATEETTDADWKWSTQSGSYHAKLALGFTDLYEVTGKAKYKEIVLGLCSRSLKEQRSSGRFITSRVDSSTHMHPHSYSAEGLLYAGLSFEREDFIDSAVSATEWALDSQKKDGGIPKKFIGNKFIEYYRSDEMAQTLRLSLLLMSLGKIPGTKFKSLELLRKKLLEFQYAENGSQKGGFYYGQTLTGDRPAHINSWCTMFALQALVMFDGLNMDRGKTLDTECLI
ncbi:MAG: glycoside hydrolase family 88 protein [Candidatus Omnitrophica bacterium]|nr:glycoside hydrolase family 88 protein [Candidatus Omnitrophota bacterium]